jgi:hypothetical protein
MDGVKPILMWTQISIFLLAGLSLFAVAFHQSKSQKTLTLSAHNETNRYGQVSRAALDNYLIIHFSYSNRHIFFHDP